MEVSVEVDKISKCAIYNTVFFPSGGGDDDVLVKLLLIKQITKDVNLMCFQCQTSTDILGIVNEFVQHVQNYFQYLHIPI